MKRSLGALTFCNISFSSLFHSMFCMQVHRKSRKIEKYSNDIIRGLPDVCRFCKLDVRLLRDYPALC